jgi:cell division transport system ATP-binding protein
MWDKKNYIAEFKQMAIYQQKKLILNGLNFKIRAGEFIYILGGNASGKSSLLKILMGRLPLIEGEGRLFDFELNALDQLSLPILRRRLGILSWEYPLLKHRTLEENLNLVLLATDWQDAAQRQARISQVLDLLKLSALRFAKADSLTQGERAKALFARAILNQPSLLLIDEIAIGMDPETTENLLSSIYTYAQATQTAVLFATNRPEIPEQFPGKIFRIQNGQLNSIQNLPPPAS